MTKTTEQIISFLESNASYNDAFTLVSESPNTITIQAYESDSNTTSILTIQPSDNGYTVTQDNETILTIDQEDLED